jgi:predicted ferric reductase
MGSGTVPRPRGRAAGGRADSTGRNPGDPNFTGEYPADGRYPDDGYQADGRYQPDGYPADSRHQADGRYQPDGYPADSRHQADGRYQADGYPADSRHQADGRYQADGYPADSRHRADGRHPGDGYGGDRYGDEDHDSGDDYADFWDDEAGDERGNLLDPHHADRPAARDVFPQSGGIRTGEPRTGGTRTGGPRTSGPQSGGTRTGGPRTGGTRTGGPLTGGTRTGGPRTGGPRTGGPRSGGPRSGGIRTGELRAPGRPAPASELARLATPRWWRTAAAGLGWSSLSVVVAFWAANAQAEGLATPSDLIDAAGRLAGLLSADLLLLQGITMARIPWLERTHGQDGLARVHRRMGFWSFNLLLAHIVLITVGYALAAKMDVVAELIDLVTNSAGVLLATAATGFLTLVVVTSIRIARRRTRYETWHLLHLYAYLGIGLSIPHELAIGGDFTASPLATAYWWTVYLFALGALLIWRVSLPLYRVLRYGLRVERVVPEGPGVVSVHIRGRNLTRLNAGAGQFFLWRFLGGKGWTRAHPYSLSAAPTADRLRITVKELGDDSSRLIHLRPGTRVIVEGPFGRLHSGVRTCRKVTLFAAGIGITPMRALLEELDFAPGDLTLLYRATDERELVLAQEIDQLAEHKGARVHYLIGPRRRSRRRGSWLPQAAGSLNDVDGLLHLVPDIGDQDVYLCGPDPWIDSVMHALRRARVRPDRIHLERFSW